MVSRWRRSAPPARISCRSSLEIEYAVRHAANLHAIARRRELHRGAQRRGQPWTWRSSVSNPGEAPGSRTNTNCPIRARSAVRRCSTRATWSTTTAAANAMVEVCYYLAPAGELAGHRRPGLHLKRQARHHRSHLRRDLQSPLRGCASPLAHRQDLAHYISRTATRRPSHARVRRITCSCSIHLSGSMSLRPARPAPRGSKCSRRRSRFR